MNVNTIFSKTNSYIYVRHIDKYVYIPVTLVLRLDLVNAIFKLKKGFDYSLPIHRV